MKQKRFHRVPRGKDLIEFLEKLAEKAWNLVWRATYTDEFVRKFRELGYGQQSLVSISPR